MKHYFSLLSSLSLLLLSLPGLCVASFERSQLPLPTIMDAGDVKVLEEVLKLEVYKDTEDPNLYYYVPPFHIRQYIEGAASLMLFSTKIEKYDQADKIVRDRKSVGASQLSAMQQEELRWSINRVQEAEDDLKIAMLAEKKNPELIKMLEIWVSERTHKLEKLRQEMLLYNIQASDEKASIYLATMGHDVDLYQCNEDERILRLKKGLLEASQSYGGYLGLTAYAGFTEEELEALRLYRVKYMPHLSIMLLPPLERLSFKPLTSSNFDKDLGVTSSTIFTDVNGSGDYLGASIILDISVEGGKSLATHLGPFIVPVGIVATFKHKIEPFEAELRCNNMAGFISKGRVDNVDGGIIWDNDVSKSLYDKDTSEGGCKLTIEKGDAKSAEYEALKILEEQFDKIHIHKTEIAYAEKHLYHQQMLKDAEEHQNRGSSKLSTYLPYLTFGWGGVITAALSYAKDFYWHTSKHNIERISEFKFHKKISYGDKVTKTIERDLPPNLCLVYNLATKAYDRCTEAEHKQAKTMRQSAEEARVSPECKDAQDYLDCASRRDSTGALPNRPNLPVRDHRLKNSI